jgi:hypothetical protein
MVFINPLNTFKDCLRFPVLSGNGANQQENKSQQTVSLQLRTQQVHELRNIGQTDTDKWQPEKWVSCPPTLIA